MSTRWISITVDNLATFQAGAMIVALQTAALKQGQSDPVPEAIAQIILKIRAAIRSGNYRVDVDPTKIPEELTSDAIVLIVEYAKPRIRQKVTEDEVRLANAARAQLKEIALGKISVAEPDDPEAADTNTQTPGSWVTTVPPAKTVPVKNDFNGL